MRDLAQARTEVTQREHWDRGRLARRIPEGLLQVNTSHSCQVFALRAQCGRDAHSPSNNVLQFP
jgi:hypothetical protein